ncbi:hypothetical protein C3747_25g253 [Trypanosoma cruzi]|uniref:Target of rapamycin (TOR) kinase 1 n=1 Tax=Trypanosoma cruzi TaxID=5693 RepID=A0A2V2X6M8_TRYCR|nr:hypothetical protein C3747_25g253 [Trypanosoma cruzi]
MRCLWERQVVFVKRWKRPSQNGLAVPFAAVLDKPSGQRRRFIAWPKASNAHEDAGVMVALPFHISQYLGAMWDETAALLDVDASFYRQLFWRICTGEFPLSSGICGSCGIDSPAHGPRVLSGSFPHHREGLGGRPRDGKTAVCGAARGKETSVWIWGVRTSGLRRSVVQRGPCQEL